MVFESRKYAQEQKDCKGRTGGKEVRESPVLGHSDLSQHSEDLLELWRGVFQNQPHAVADG